MIKKGRGMACMFYPNGSTGKANPTGAFIKINHDGTAVLNIGATDIGQGSNTCMAQIAAAEIGLKLSQVRVVTGDTEVTPYDAGTGACRVTYIAGNAVQRAAKKAKEMLLDAAARKLGVIHSGQLKIEEGEIFLRYWPAQRLSIAEAALYSERVLGKPIIAVDSYSPATMPLDAETGQGMPFEVSIYATQIAEVEVDTDTGEVKVTKLVAVHDCGRMLNPMLVEGQVEGGAVTGIGYGLYEQILEDPKAGGILNPSLATYQIPTSLDVPEDMIVDCVEVPEEKGPFGAKGVSEPACNATAPAIINAIYNATGVCIHDLPATREKMLFALRALEQNK